MTVLERLRADATITLRSYTKHAAASVKRVRGRSAADLHLKTHERELGDDDAIGTGLAGDDVIRQIHENITIHMKVVRFQFQAMIHERMLNTVLHLIYAKDWDQHRERIMRYRTVKGRYKQFLICSAPRREGKTWTLTMLLAAMMDLVPMRIAVFSISKRVSSWFMEQVQKFYFMLPGARGRVAQNNTETFSVSPTGQLNHPSQSTLICLPNSEKSRGISAELVVWEEAQFLPSSQIQNVGAPLFRMGKTSVVAISSPGEDRNNLIQRLMDENKDKPDAMIDVAALEMLCDDCCKAKLTECEHKIMERPPWISLDKAADVQSMYAGNTIRMQRELMGMSVSEDVDAFDFKQVAACFAAEPVGLDERPGWVFHCIDTSGSGRGSDTAFVSIIFNKLHQCVVRGSECSVHGSHFPQKVQKRRVDDPVDGFAVGSLGDTGVQLEPNAKLLSQERHEPVDAIGLAIHSTVLQEGG